MSFIKFLQNQKLLRNLIFKLGTQRAQKELYPKVIDQLNKYDKILDLGSGTCCLAQILVSKGFNVTLLDVENISFVDGLNPTLYDGETIPYPDKSFDIVLLLAVLHHTHKPESILKEANRVGKKVIVIEDVFNSYWKMKLGHFLDSITNLEFAGHPHSNKSDDQWKRVFRNNTFR